MTNVAWRDYDTASEMASAVADHIGLFVEAALDSRGEALVALPGGKSPIPLFERLATAKIDWSRVTIIPTDDRLVPVTDSLSNVAMIARHFLPKGAHVLPIVVEGDADYRTAGEAADAQLAKVAWPPDLVCLGVGADGHTASIFPGPDLEDALDGPPNRRALGLMPDPLPAVISGAQKRAVVERALRAGRFSRTPIGRVLADAKTRIEIHWSET